MATKAQLGGAAAATTATVGGGGYGISLVVSNNEKNKESFDDESIGKESKRNIKKKSKFSRFNKDKDYDSSSLQDTTSKDFGTKSSSTTRKHNQVIKLEKPSHVSVFGSNAQLEGYEGKILDWTKKDHLNFLVKPLDASNKDWWNWFYKDIYLVKSKTPNFQLDHLFSSLTSGFSENKNDKALNQACEKAYKEDQERYAFINSSLLKNIGQFCVKVENITEEKDISEPKVETYKGVASYDTPYQRGVLSQEKNRQYLVKDISDNKLWWNWFFRKEDLWRGNRRGFPELFKYIEVGYSPTPSNEPGKFKALNKACDEAYKKNRYQLKNETGVFNKIKELCSINKQAALVEPDWYKPDKVVTLSKPLSAGIGKVQENLAKLVANISDNKDFWDWSYENNFPKDHKQRKLLPYPFKSATKSYFVSSGAVNGLNEACDFAYTVDLNTVELPTSGKGWLGGKSFLQLVKLFCSPDSTLGELRDK